MSVKQIRGSKVRDVRQVLNFLLKMSRLLIESGCSSNRVEHLIAMLAQVWELDVDTMALPTGVWICVRFQGRTYMEMSRVKDWSTNLERMSQISDMVDKISVKQMSIVEADELLEKIAELKPPYNSALTILAGAGASSMFVASFHGSLLEIALVFPLGALVLLANKYIFAKDNPRYLADFLSAVIVATYAMICKSVYEHIDLPMMIIGGVIILVPGLVLVNAVHEIAQKNLVSGVAKLVEALMITASIASGVVTVLGLSQQF